MEGGVTDMEMKGRETQKNKLFLHSLFVFTPPTTKTGGGGSYKTFIIPGKIFNVDDIKRLKRGGGFRVKGGEEQRMHIKVEERAEPKD